MCSQARHQRTKMTEQERRLMERYTSDTSLRLSRHVHMYSVYLFTLLIILNS